MRQRSRLSEIGLITFVLALVGTATGNGYDRAKTWSEVEADKAKNPSAYIVSDGKVHGRKVYFPLGIKDGDEYSTGSEVSDRLAFKFTPGMRYGAAIGAATGLGAGLILAKKKII